MEIRRLAPGDLAILSAALAEIFDAVRDRFYSAETLRRGVIEYEPSKLARRAFGRNGITLGSFSDTTLTGFVFGAADTVAGLFYVDWLGVLPTYQRRGIGRSLLSKLEEEVVEIGCHKVFLYTTPENEPALRLYEQLDYSIEGEHPKHFFGAKFLSLGKVLVEQSAEAA